MPLPDFLIIGAMKAGTTTLQAQLAAQPGVFMSTPKEPNFFSDDDVFARGRGWYEGLFADAAPGDLKGEASTHYTKLPTYPETVARMRAMLPSPKLIYVLRDPLERAISHYRHEWTTGVMGNDVRAAFAAHPELVDYSCYAMQIAPFVEAFGRDRILLLHADDMKRDPDGVMALIGAHLGRPDLRWDHALGEKNVSTERFRKLPMHGVLVDNPVARALRHTLVPKRLRERVRRMRAPKASADLPETLTDELRRRFAADEVELARLFPDVVRAAG